MARIGAIAAASTAAVINEDEENEKLSKEEKEKQKKLRSLVLIGTLTLGIAVLGAVSGLYLFEQFTIEHLLFALGGIFIGVIIVTSIVVLLRYKQMKDTENK